MRRVLLSLSLIVAVAGPGVAAIPRAGAAEATVTFTDRANPATLTVAPGTTVTFANQSGERRRIRSEDGPEEFDSGNLDPGARWSVALHAAGTYAYVDDRDRDDTAYHGTITVGVSPAPGGSAGAPPAGSAAPSAPAAASVAILDRSFAPATVAVAAGGTVSWTNQSDRDHTVTGAGFDSGGLGGGGRFAHTFPSAGTFAYVCDFHPEMRASVVVTSAAGGATAAPAAPPAAAPPPSAPAAGPGPGAAQSAAAPGGTATGDGADGPTAAPAGPWGDGSAPDTAEVSVADFAFAPAGLRLAAGGTVIWRLTGTAPHTVSGTNREFDSGLLEPGATFSHRFDAAGTYEYVCAFHPQMAATVEVVDGTPSPAGESAVVDGTAGAEGGTGGGEQAAARLTGDNQPASSRWSSVLAALLAVAALLAGTGALLYGGSRMMAADEGR